MFKPGPLYERRKEILRLLQEVPLQTGDIVYSASNATGPLGIPFGSLIQTFTKSPYSHATLILRESDEIYAIDVSDWGTRKLRVVDWFDNWGTTDFCVVRLVNIDKTMSGCLADSINAFLRDDPSYDFNFDDVNAYYCTEAVAAMLGRCGVDLGGAFLIKDIVPSWFYPLLVAGSWLTKVLTNSSLPTNRPIHIVGNEKKGMLASEKTKMIFEYDGKTDTCLRFLSDSFSEYEI